MKEGSRVRIRRDSEFADQNDGVGIIYDIRVELPYPMYVKFDDDYRAPYRKQDLEPAEKYTEEGLKQIKEENKEIIDKFYKQPFNLFKRYLKQQVEEIIENKEFDVGDKVRVSNNSYECFGVEKGSDGEIISDCVYGYGNFEVKFIGKSLFINYVDMEHLTQKKILKKKQVN